MKTATLAVMLAAAIGGCAIPSSREDSIHEVDENVNALEIQAAESRTMSGLAKLEESLTRYLETEKKIPERLENMIPKYLAEMPRVEIHVRGHHETDGTKNYPSTVLRDGQIDGTKLKDTGRWGYVYNDRQVVVFIDCTHKSSRGRGWYLERGVY
jgi:hypothetical protein